MVPRNSPFHSRLLQLAQFSKKQNSAYPRIEGTQLQGPDERKSTGKSSIHTVFFFWVGLGRDSTFTGIHGTCFGQGSARVGHRRMGPINRGNPRGILGATRYPRNTTGRASIIAGNHRVVCAGFYNSRELHEMQH